MDVKSVVNEVLGVPFKYMKETSQKDRIVCVLHRSWISSLVRSGLTQFQYHECYSEDEVEAFLKLGEGFGTNWQHVSIRILPLSSSKKVIPLPRARPPPASSSSQNLSYSQLLHYVAHTNYKNLWKESYKKYFYSSDGRESPNISLAHWDTILLDIISRTYGCPIVCIGSQQGMSTPRNIEPHANCLPALCAVYRGSSQPLLLLQPFIAYSAHDCVSFSPAVLSSSRSRPLFIIFQLLQLMRDSHDRGLILGDITLHDLLLTEGLWLQAIPRLEDNLHSPTGHREKRNSSGKTQKLDVARISHPEARGIVSKSLDEGHELHQVALSQLLDLWVRGRLSNLDYLTALNCLAGRCFGHPSHHHVLPWVTDFSSPNGGWRDLTRSKFRINKGDRQLDLTYDAVLSHHSSPSTEVPSPAQVPHHVSDVLSEITYYVYMARRTPRSLLCKYVRPKWVPAEYPSSIQRMQDWTPDECIPEFYTDPTTFKSIHEDLPNLEVPSWASSPEHFIEKHRQALESVHVSERLHHWIDLTFGYKLSGTAAVKSKNVCLYLVDRHTHLTDSGVVQLFSQPHPHRFIPSPYAGKVAPKLVHMPFTSASKRKPEKSLSSVTSPSGTGPSGTGVEDETTEASEDEPRPLGLTKLLSKSRSSLLLEESSSSRSIVQLPKEYNPIAMLQDVENMHNFTNQVFCEPPHLMGLKGNTSDTTGFRQAVASRRIKEMQVLGCVIVELYLANKMQAVVPVPGLDSSSSSTFEDRLQKCLLLLEREWYDLPYSVKQALALLLQLDESGKRNEADKKPDAAIKYPTITSTGLPPPSAHQLLQPLISFAFPFPCYFEKLYSLLLTIYKLEKKDENCSDKKIEIFSRELPALLPLLDSDGLELLLPHIRDLLRSPSATSAAWQLFDPIAKALGPRATNTMLLDPICDLFENGGASRAKLYHRSFLLKLIVRLGLKTFINNFATALVEAVGGYRDQHCKSPTEQRPTTEQQRHKPAPLKSASMGSLSAEGDINGILSPLDEDSSADSERLPTVQNVKDQVDKRPDGDETDAETEPEVFVFESNEDEEEESTKRSPPAVALDLMAQLELDMKFDQETDGSSPLPTTAEEDTVLSPSCEMAELAVEEPTSIQHQQEWRSPRKPTAECPVSEMSADSILWLAHRLGPVLTAKHLSRNLLRMLSLCYLGEESLTPTQRLETCCHTIPGLKLVGDKNAARVIDCLASIAALYGEQLVISQYFPHISELIALCKRKLTANLEGGLIGCLALLRHIVPYLSDASLMDHISDILKSILHPAVRLVATTRAPFPSGVVARTALAYKLLEALYVIALRIGTDMTQLHLAPTLQRFFLAFDKAFGNTTTECGSMGKSYDENCYLDIKRDGTSMEWPIKGSPLQISHSRVKETDSADSFSPPVPLGNQDASQEIRSKAMQELKMVFTEKLAHQAYLPFFRFIGENAFEQFLKNGPSIQKLCYDYEQQNPRLIQCQDQGHLLYLSDYLSPHEENERGTSGSFGSNVAVIGNRIELQRPDIPSIKPLCSPTCSSVTQEDVAALISKKMDNTSRHLHGNWLAYWEHEIGRAEKDMRFNFKQIKLQQFIGHTNSVRAIHALNNENSFMSGSRDKTVKLWSLRSQGDGRATTSCQWTYSNHRKSVLAIAFLESMRLVASCDSVVHLWDPFMGALVAQLDSSTSSRAVIPPVNVLRSMPAPSCCVLAATTDATLRVIDARTCSYVQELKVAPSTAGLIRCVAVGPSGNWVAVGQSSGHLSLLDIRTGMVLASWKGHEGEVLQLVTANESTMVSSSLDQSVGAWSTDLGNLKFHLKGPTEPVHCLSSYGSELISGTTANRIGVHTSVGDQASFSSTRLRSDTFRGVLTAMAVLPLNRLLLLGSDAGHISLLC